MKRKIYFFLERLEIKRSERISITILLISIVVMSAIYHLNEPKENYDPDHYRELELIFEERSRRLHSEREEILARYRPNDKADLIMLPRASQPEEASIQQFPDSNESAHAERETAGERININTASKEQLESLPGIGPAYAERIVAWREENGLFTSIDQLLEIRGIGERRLEQLIPLIEL